MCTFCLFCVYFIELILTQVLTPTNQAALNLLFLTPGFSICLFPLPPFMTFFPLGAQYLCQFSIYPTLVPTCLFYTNNTTSLHSLSTAELHNKLARLCSCLNHYTVWFVFGTHHLSTIIMTPFRINLYADDTLLYFTTEFCSQ